MTESTLTSPPAVSTGSFDGIPFGPDLVSQIVNLLVGGSPFSDSLTRIVTSRNSIAWLTSAPEEASWLHELEPFPLVPVGGDIVVVEVRKLGKIFAISNEAVSDATIDLFDEIGRQMRDSLSRQLDLGVLHGTGDPQPDGVVGLAPEATGASLLQAIAVARGSIYDAGGIPDRLALSGTALTAADAATDDQGALLFPNGFAAAAQLEPVVVPGLDVPLVYDRTRCYLVVHDTDTSVETSNDYFFREDAQAVRVRARVTVGIPNVNAAIRRLVVGDGVERRAAEPAAKKTAAKKA